jgi:hypothetical protein
MVSGIAHKPHQAIKNIRGTPAAYESTTVFEEGAYQTYIITHCIECGGKFQIHWNTGGADPAFVERKFRGLGWQFDAYKPKNCVCPECVKGRKFAAGGALASAIYNISQEEPVMAKSTTPTNSYAPPTTDTGVLTAVKGLSESGHYDRTLTSHEKAKLRVILDGHFDDQLGRYLDNYDDKKVGLETDLPWALVAQYRELAYGPIKPNPAIEAFTKELAIMQEELKALSNAIEAMRARFEAYSGRLVNLEAKAKKL